MHRLILFMQDNWGWVLSVAGVLGSALGYILTHIRALQSGVQALLRAQMIDLYNHCTTLCAAELRKPVGAV